MGTLSRRRLSAGSACLTLSLALMLGAPAFPVQALSPYVPPETRLIDPNGVDLAGSTWYKTDTFLTIGDPANGGLAWSYSGHEGHDSYTGALRFFDTLLDADYWTASFGESSVVFYTEGASAANNYATLAHVGSTWVVTRNDGTVLTYGEQVIISPVEKAAPLLKVERPNGSKITLNYVGGACTGDPFACRPASVVSNQGYALRYDYNGSNQLIKVWAVNTSAHTCNATATTCDVYDNYVTLGSASTISDALGNTTTIQTDICGAASEKWCTFFYQTPSGAQITAAYDYYGRIETLTNATGTWAYTYTDLMPGDTDHKGPHKTVVKDPNNVTFMTSSASFDDARVLYKRDGLSRQTNYEYTGFAAPGSAAPIYKSAPAGIILPEGNKSNVTYDARGNVTAVTQTPKTGSGLSATSITASYDLTCSNMKTCNQPNWTRDQNSQQTDYTYSATHGGVLTTTAPMDYAMLRLRTYYTYGSYNTGDGTIYRLTQTESCGLTTAQLSLTACPTTTPRMITTYTYLGKTSLPLTVTQSDGGSLSSVVTNGYDNIGNLISVDGPLSGTGDQSFTTYDANRRKIYEIGPIPGTGTIKRTVVKHTYNGSGLETKTELGYANTNATDGSDFVVVSFKRMTYDTVGRLVKSEEVLP